MSDGWTGPVVILTIDWKEIGLVKQQHLWRSSSLQKEYTFMGPLEHRKELEDSQRLPVLGRVT